MKNIAVITEYNPFHGGHSIQIDYIKEKFGEDSRIIAIMSGNTVQRGEVAVYDKYKRAECAVNHGVSAVFELPFPFSSSCAEIFARAGVYIAKALGGIDTLVFGSESGDIDALTLCAKRLESEEFQKRFSEYSQDNKNISHIKRTEMLYCELYGDGTFPKTANDILAVEYIKAAREQGAEFCLQTYKRLPGFTASGARRSIRTQTRTEDAFEGENNPAHTEMGENYTDEKKAGELIIQYLLKEDPRELEGIFDLPSDLLLRMKRAANETADFRSFMDFCRNPSYTDARIKRALLYIWCDVRKKPSNPLYTAVLALDEKGREYLSAIRKTADIEILTKPADYKEMGGERVSAYETALRAEWLFAHSLKSPMPPSQMMKKRPYIKESGK